MGVFDRIVVGIDGGDAGVEAVRQADRLAPDGRTMRIVTVRVPAVVSSGAGMAVLPVVESDETYEASLAAARAALAAGRDAETVLLDGPPIPLLHEQIEQAGATLVAFGVHERSRLAGIVGGSVGTALLHEATCAVLAVRPGAGGDGAPRSIAVAVDGSDCSLRALAAAVEVAERTGASLAAWIATDGDELDPASAKAAVEQAAPGVEVVVSHQKPVDALAGTAADLLVIGSRGLSGPKALGSVSERVAHKARCSVLVVR